MKKKGKNLEDIYHTPPWPPKEPDYVWKMPEELEQQLRRHRIRSALLVLCCLFLLFVLAVVLIRETRVEAPPIPVVKPAETEYVAHYTLPSDDLWVMSYQQAESGLQLEGAMGDKPVSTKWIKNVAYHVIVGQQALAMQRYEKAAIHLEKALVIFPEIHGVHGSLGTAYLKQQRFEEAIPPLRKALAEEESFSATSNLGIALLATRRFEEAEKHLLRALALNPDHPGCHKNLALLYQKTGPSEKALNYFETYFSLYDEDLPAIEQYAEYLLEIGQRERAAVFLNKTCRRQPMNALPLYLLLARIEAAATNEVKAVEALQNITRYISPNIALTQMNSEDFDTIRDSGVFQDLLYQIELAAVTLENKN